MTLVSNLSDIARSEKDPKVLGTGPSSLGLADRMARMLGWFSFALGVTEIAAPRMITRPLGMEGYEALVRAYGFREIGAGILSLSATKQVGLWSRVAGDALDIATVLPAATRQSNPKRNKAALAVTLLAGVALIDLVAAQSVTYRHSRGSRRRRSYRDRSGFPQGVESARGAASALDGPPGLETELTIVEAAISDTGRPDGGAAGSGFYGIDRDRSSMPR